VAFPKLIKAIMRGNVREIHSVEGIVYKKGKRVIETRNAQLTAQEIATLPFIYAKQSKEEVLVKSFIKT